MKFLKSNKLINIYTNYSNLVPFEYSVETGNNVMVDKLNKTFPLKL